MGLLLRVHGGEALSGSLPPRNRPTARRLAMMVSATASSGAGVSGACRGRVGRVRSAVRAEGQAV